MIPGPENWEELRQAALEDIFEFAEYLKEEARDLEDFADDCERWLDGDNLNEMQRTIDLFEFFDLKDCPHLDEILTHWPYIKSAPGEGYWS
jgi:hypothetical protein